MEEQLKINKPIRLIELFAGIGSQAKALKRLGADFEHYRICEFDKYAIKSYNAIHGTNFETSDITKIVADDLGIVDTNKYCYIMTYSFPCQDLSLAGKGKGMAKGDNTRSGLLWEVERLLNECSELPQILLMENVTQVHGKKNKEHFDEWIAFLESKGYANFWKDLNAKNFGIPQNRNRCFMVSVLGNYTYEFPKEFPLELRLKDMLETEVDEKFYLSDLAIQGRMQSAFRQYNLERSLVNEKEVHPTILARYEGAPTLLKEPKLLGGIGEKNFGKQYRQGNRIYDSNAVAMALGASPVGNAGGHSYLYAVDDPFVCASRGRNPENPSDRRAGIHLEQRLEPNFSGCTNTITTVQKDNYVAEPQVLRSERTEYGKAIRKQYESGEVYEKIGNMREMKPRTDGVANTITTLLKDNYVAEPIINKIDIPQTVRVRKYEVDCAKLCEVLREHKTSCGLNNQDIASQLNLPLTKVEHWFRQDKYFAIPDEDIWFDLKALLGIKTNEFDESIITFEEREGVFEKSNRCYLSDGLAPTITSASASEKVIEPTINVVGNYSPSGHEASRIVDANGLAPTVKENHGTVTALVEPIVCEQRSDEGLRFFKGDYVGALRTIDACGDKRVIVPANNKKGYDEAAIGDSINLEQPNSTTRRGRVGHGVAQTLNTAPQQAVVEDGTDRIIREDPLEREGWHDHAKEVISPQGVCRTLCAQSNNLVTKIKEPINLRIRKLTPKECWRLMGFDDCDFEGAAKVNSNSQLYKQAGNSIVVDVLYHIFKNML